MSRGAVFIPCPNCRAVVLYDAGPDGRPFCESCIVCELDFPPYTIEAVASFLRESPRTNGRPGGRSQEFEDPRGSRRDDLLRGKETR